MNVEKDDSAENLITRCLTGEASAEEQLRLDDWRAKHSGNEKLFQDFKKTFDWSNRHLAARQSQKIDVDVDHEWNEFRQTIQPEQARSVQLGSGVSFGLRMAAAILLLVTAGAVTYYWATKNSEMVYETAANTLNVELPDGSQVVLNQNSRLTYEKDFGEETRNVFLSGEAFFEVAHNAQRPFVIEVGRAEVQVLGTSFNVFSYRPEEKIEVVVTTGTVKLSVPQQKKQVTLRAGDKGVYAPAAQQLTSERNSDVNFAAWKTKHIVFEEVDLRTVVETLNRVYGANIKVSAAIPATCVVTVSFDQQSLEAIMTVLKDTLNLTYRGEGKSIEIIEAGC